MRLHGFKAMRRGACLLLFCCTLGDCGTTVGRVPFSREGEGQTGVQLARGDLHFWTEFDARYRGEMNASYEVDLIQQDKLVGTATCDPLHLGTSRVCSARILVGETHTIHCRMECTVSVPQPGSTLVRARLSIHERPTDLRLQRADLILKQ
jgi:hypothetical protein